MKKTYDKSRAKPERGPAKRSSAPRDPEAPYWLYGLHPVSMALANPARKPRQLIATRNAAQNLDAAVLEAVGLEIEISERKAIDRLVPADAVHQGIALLVDPLPEGRLDKLLKNPDAETFVVLDQVTDPHNVGAIFRSAAAFGASAIITTRRHAPNETAVLVKAAAGTFDLLPYVRLGNLAAGLEKLKDAGITLVGLDAQGTADINTVPAGKTALIMGSEGKGMRQRTTEMCDYLIRLEINPAVESLNVSNAAAVALYALGNRQDN